MTAWINEDNYQDAIDGSESTGWLGRKLPFGSLYSAADVPIIPRNEWKQRIKDNQGNFLSDLMIAGGYQIKYQNGLNYCWAYGSVSCIEALEIIQGRPYVNLSPESLGGPIANWRNVGGYAEDACQGLLNVGCCESSFMDKPRSLSPSRWKAGWQADCANHRIDVEWDDVPRDFDVVISLLFARRPIAAGLDWWRHLVCFTDPIILPDDTVGVKFANSHDVTYGDEGWGTLSESRAVPNGAFSPRMATPK